MVHGGGEVREVHREHCRSGGEVREVRREHCRGVALREAQREGAALLE